MSRRQRRNPATAITKWPGTTQDGRAVRSQIETIITETPPATHASTHENGGSDEINVGGLSGVLADPQTPAAHAASHASGGGDPVTIAEAQVTGLVADLAAKAPTSRTITAGAGLTGGGDLSADRTLDVGAGTGITVAANSVAADFGTGAGKVTEGNDARLSDTRTPTDNTVSTAKLQDDAVTYAKLQNVSATARVLGRKTAGAGDVEECTLSQILDFIGSAAQGDVLYRGAAGWARLPAGTSGDVLTTQGAGADPLWDTPTAGSGTPADTVEDLDGTGDAGASTEYSRGDHKHADANRPTNDEKDALAGTDGTPDAGNPYVTDSDPRNTNARTPSAHTHAEADVTGLVADLAAKVPTSRQVISGAGLTGGGDLSADRTLAVGAGTGITVNADDVAVNYGTTAVTACVGNDARLSDARTPTAHKTSHQDGGADEMSVTGLSGLLADAQTPLAHNVLSASHGDTVAASVVRGDIVYGNSTPKWARKAVGTGVLVADGTDVTGWTQSPTLASPVVTTLLDLQGGQIKFPATQIPSSDPNTLDDYEEGDWTPVDVSGAALTLKNPDDHTNGAKGRYVKIGQMIYQAHKIEYPVTADGSTAKIGGFPFTTENAAVPMYWGGYHTYTNSNGVTWNLNANKTNADAFYGYAPGLTAQTNANMSAKVIYGNIQYRCTA